MQNHVRDIVYLKSEQEAGETLFIGLCLPSFATINTVAADSFPLVITARRQPDPEINCDLLY